MAYIECTYCNGEGIAACPHSSDDDTCPVCEGLGERPMTDDEKVAAFDAWAADNTVTISTRQERAMARYEQRQERRQARRDKRARMAFFTR